MVAGIHDRPGVFAMENRLLNEKIINAFLDLNGILGNRFQGIQICGQYLIFHLYLVRRRPGVLFRIRHHDGADITVLVYFPPRSD